jgi:hypothetical protein
MIASGFTRVILTVILAAISVAAQCIFDWTAANGETCAIIASVREHYFPKQREKVANTPLGIRYYRSRIY